MIGILELLIEHFKTKTIYVLPFLFTQCLIDLRSSSLL